MGSFSNDSNERRGTSRKRRSLALIAAEAPIAQREPGRQLLNVAVGGQDLAVAVMVVPCLPAVRVSSYSLTGVSVTWSTKSHGGGQSAAAPGTASRTGRDRGQADGAARRLYAHAEMRAMPVRTFMHSHA